MTFFNRLDRKTTFFFLENLVQGVSQAFHKTCKHIELLNEFRRKPKDTETFKSSSLFIFCSQSFLDLEYAILEVGVDETTTVENKNIYKFSHGKIHPRKKKKRKREANCAETKIQQSTTAESFQPPRKIASLAECCNSAVPMLQSDILPTFPDTPPSFDLIPDAKPIEYRA